MSNPTPTAAGEAKELDGTVDPAAPTGGAARFSSALRIADFQKHIHVVRADATGLARVGPAARSIAEAEGMTAHAAAVEMRERLRG